MMEPDPHWRRAPDLTRLALEDTERPRDLMNAAWYEDARSISAMVKWICPSRMNAAASPTSKFWIFLGSSRLDGPRSGCRLNPDLMCVGFDPLRLLLISISGWMNQQQRDVDYLREENRVLRQQLGSKRLRLSDDQRVRLAAKAKKLVRRVLGELATIVTLGNALGLAPQTDRQEIRQQ